MTLSVEQVDVRAGSTTHPLGPVLIQRGPARHARFGAGTLVTAAVMAAPLFVAVFLTPDPSGTGTHRGLGYGDCPFLVEHGFACPTCGMTTAFAHTVRGQWIRAFDAQPMGWLLAMLSIVVAGVNLYSFVTGGSIAVNWYRVTPARIVIVTLVLTILAWGYKVAISGVLQ